MSDFSIRPQPLLGHFVPGLIVIVAALFWVRDANHRLLIEVVLSFQNTAFITSVLIVVSYGVGELLDSVRDLLEELVDWDAEKYLRPKWLGILFAWFGVKEVDWSFFQITEDPLITNHEVWYFTYYMLDVNLSLGLFALTLAPWWKLIGFSGASVLPSLRWTVCTAAVIFLLNGGRLRSQMADYMKRTPPKMKI